MLVARAPGRVNLIGDHTDYQAGWCLPMAIDREVRVEVATRADGRVHARTEALVGEADLAADGRDDLATAEPAWARTVIAVLRVLREHGRSPVGFDASFTSTVPVGSGLSSSAAFEIALTLAAARVGDLPLAGRELALAGQAAEQLASGVPCGVMDQMASVFGVAGHALLLDCRTLAVEPAPMPPAAAVVVTHSGPRRLADTEYAARRAACEAAAARLGLTALRDATADQVADDPIARHVVSENARVLACFDALRAGDVEAVGTLMLASHASLRDDFGVSTPALDELVERLVTAGAYGARLTGAGFGGCVVGLVPAARATEIATAAGGFVVHAAAGAGIIS